MSETSETPNFTAIARALAQQFSSDRETYVALIVEQLRRVWNARGAADAQAVESRIRELVAGEVIGAGIARHVAEAIAKADR